MSQAINLCDDSDDNGEWPSTNTASVPPLLLSRKRLRDKEESSKDTYLRSDNGPGDKTAAGSAEFIIDLELADRVEVVSPNKKRRVVVRTKRSLKNGAAGKCAQILKGVHATEVDDGSEDAQVAGHREHHEGIATAAAAAASHPMNSESEQKSRDDCSSDNHSQKRSNSEPPSKESRQQLRDSAWEDRLSELSDYRKIHGHCNVPRKYSENTKLGQWAATQRINYRLDVEGKTSPMTPYRIKALESLGFEWDCYGAAWEDRLSELADYRTIHGHCNVPYNYSENTKLATWVENQRSQYRLHVKGNASYMTLSRIQALESLGFEWHIKGAVTAWEDRLNELADYRKIHGDCNVPMSYSENTKLGKWVNTQRTLYRLQLQGKISSMTLSRIQKLECIGFEWNIGRGKGKPKKVSPDDDAVRARERAVDKMQEHSLRKTSAVEKSAAIKTTPLSNPKYPTGMAKSSLTLSQVEPRAIKASDPRFAKTDLDCSPSELAAKPSLYSESQAAKSLSADKSAVAGDNVEANTRKDALQAKVPWPAHQQISIKSISHALLIAGSPENDPLFAAKRPANSRPCAESQKETAHSDEVLRVNPVAAAELQQRHNVFTHALLLGDGSTGNGDQATQEKVANATQGMEQTPPDEVFQSDNVLNEIELELNWLGEESMYCLSCPEFQFDFIYEYASPALKVELRKLSRDDQSETEKLKQIVRMKDWLVSQRFDFVRNEIRKELVGGFRRQRMGTVIAEVRLLRRQQSKRHFPAVILGRSEIAPVKASAMIEQVDMNTLKVVATFPSQSEAERQTGIPRSNISRGLRQGRPLGGCFWRSVR